MEQIAQAVSELLHLHPDTAVIWPVHLNPLVQQVVRAAHAASPQDIQRRWRLTAPLDYPPMVEIMNAAQLLLTDSGGIQEEGLSLHKPLLVMRDVTHQIREGNRSIVGLMIESNIEAGNQPIPADLSQLRYGCSVTDACVDWATTETMIREMRDTLRPNLSLRSAG